MGCTTQMGSEIDKIGVFNIHGFIFDAECSKIYHKVLLNYLVKLTKYIAFKLLFQYSSIFV